MPMFYFVLYRYDGELPVAKPMRLLCRAAAFVLGFFVLGELRKLFLDIEFHAQGGMDPAAGGLGHFAAIANAISSVACTAVLASLYFLSNEGEVSNVSGSRLLYQTAQLATVVQGLVLIGILVQLLAMPWWYSTVDQYFLSVGGTPPPALAILKNLVSHFAVQACGFLPSLAVYISLRLAHHGLPEPTIRELEEAQ
jgi:hypothetical protein